jgi:hypothetical protein
MNLKYGHGGQRANFEEAPRLNFDLSHAVGGRHGLEGYFLEWHVRSRKGCPTTVIEPLSFRKRHK